MSFSEKTTILQTDQHALLQALLGKRSNSSSTNEESCDPIKLFNESTSDGIEKNDLVHFPNAFNYGEDCMPVDVDKKGANDWIEIKTIYVAYDDLVSDSPFGEIFRAMSKSYPISCTIDKTGIISGSEMTTTFSLNFRSRQIIHRNMFILNNVHFCLWIPASCWTIDL